MTARPFVPLALALLALLAPPSPADEDTPPAEEGQALDTFFRGAVVAFDRKGMTLRYDFSAAEHLKDWIEGVPFPIGPHSEQGVQVVDGALEIKGNTGVRHGADWTGNVEVKVTFRSDTSRNVGGLLVPATGENDYATFTFGEYFFHSFDRQTGGQHAIIKFGDQFRRGGGAGDIGFRYVARRNPASPLAQGAPVTFSFGQKGNALHFETPDFELKGRDPGNRLVDLAPGLYTIEGRILVDQVEITGRLADAWLESNGVAWRVEQAPPER
jgi:hypothetical protein